MNESLKRPAEDMKKLPESGANNLPPSAEGVTLDASIDPNKPKTKYNPIRKMLDNIWVIVGLFITVTSAIVLLITNFNVITQFVLSHFPQEAPIVCNVTCNPIDGSSQTFNSTAPIWDGALSVDPDLQSVFNTKTGIYTAPSKGWYLITANLDLDLPPKSTWTAGDTVQIKVVNADDSPSSSTLAIWHSPVTGHEQDGKEQVGMQGSVMLYLDNKQAIKLRVYSQQTTFVDSGFGVSHFSFVRVSN